MLLSRSWGLCHMIQIPWTRSHGRLRWQSECISLLDSLCWQKGSLPSADQVAPQPAHTCIANLRSKGKQLNEVRSLCTLNNKNNCKLARISNNTRKWIWQLKSSKWSLIRLVPTVRYHRTTELQSNYVLVPEGLASTWPAYFRGISNEESNVHICVHLSTVLFA